MSHDLIQACYKNNFGIDLLNYHYQRCQIKDNEINLIKDINNSGRVLFSDGLSSSFELIIYNKLVYLLGDKSCYPCSKVIESAYGSELNWVQCIVIPNNIRVHGETDIRKSSVIISLFSDLIPLIPDSFYFNNYIQKIEFTFGLCDWFKRIYSLSLYIRLATFWNYKDKIKKLFELGLLYPFEYSVFIIYNDITIKNENILKYFVSSLAESTNKIFKEEDINKFLLKLSISELEDIMSLDFIKENVNLNLLNDDTFADILELDGVERYGMFIDNIYFMNYMHQRVSLILKEADLKKKYIKIIGKKFRALENKMRNRKGFDQVGSFFMEKLLLERLKENFPNLSIISQYSPKWLQRQRLDIFIKECNLAVEYHGAQHFLPIDFFGGIEALEKRQQMDNLKKIRCYENNIEFIEITFDEDFEFAFDQLHKKITLEIFEQ